MKPKGWHREATFVSLVVHAFVGLFSYRWAFIGGAAAGNDNDDSEEEEEEEEEKKDKKKKKKKKRPKFVPHIIRLTRLINERVSESPCWMNRSMMGQSCGVMKHILQKKQSTMSFLLKLIWSFFLKSWLFEFWMKKYKNACPRSEF